MLGLVRIPHALVAFAITLLSPIVIAGQYDWIVSKLPTDLSTRDDSLSAVIGSINSQRYLAVHVNAGDETQEGFKPVLVLARIRRDNSYEPFKLIEVSSLTDLSVQIKDGAIYIRHDVAHHGTNFANYKFKPSSASFQLVAMETQSMTTAEYDGAKDHIELWNGVSVNFMTSKATYWAKAFAMNVPKEQDAWLQAVKLHQFGITPEVRIRRTIKIGRIKAPQIDIEQFDPFAFNTDFLCGYFDHRQRFHNACR